MSTLASQFKELASDLHAMELLRAVRKGGNKAEVEKWLSLCSVQGLDSRCASHSGTGPFVLCASPLWLACYRGDRATVETLLRYSGGKLDADAVACGCAGNGRAKDCTVGWQSVLHVAVARGASDTVGLLLRAGADANAPCCFACDEDDEPEWDEDAGVFGGGLKGLSALQLAALRSDESLCALLLSHGADPTTLRSMPEGQSLPPALAPQLTPILGEDGEPQECPICYESLIRLSCVWTPCCARPFHSHCIRGLDACPMCRAKLRDKPSAPEGDAELASTLAAVEEEDARAGHNDPARRPHNSLRSTSNHDRALELAFSGSQWGPDSPGSNGMGSFNSAMGTNFGWRGYSNGPV